LAVKRIRILEVLAKVDDFDLKSLATTLGLSLGKTLGLTTYLVKRGYVKKVGSSFSLSPQGRAALKELEPIKTEECFHFYTDIGRYTGLAACSLEKFLEDIEKVDVKSVEFHTSRGDFEKWMKDVFHDDLLEQEIRRIREAKLKGESLREKVKEVVNSRLKNFKTILT